MATKNLSWRITNEFNNLEEAKTCLEEHKLGAYLEVFGAIGIISPIITIPGIMALTHFGHKDLANYLVFATGIIFPSGLTTFLLTIGYANRNPNNYNHGDFYSAAKKYIKQNKLKQ